MSMKLRNTLAAALFLGLPAASTLVAVPVAAQGRTAAPVVDALQVDADSGLAPGSTLRFTARGTPRGKARVQVQGTNVAVALKEGARGVYSGSYTVRRADRIDPAALIRVSLAVGSRITVSSYSFPPAFMALANKPPAAQPQQQAQALGIQRFAADPVVTLEPGTELRFSLNGAPGANASFELPGIASGLPMRETRPGHYVGTYTLRRQDKLAAGPVVATLRAGERWVTAQLAAPLVTDNAAPVIGNLLPRQGEAVSGAGVTVVSGTFDDAGGTGVDPRSVRVTLAGRDVTAHTQVTPQSFSYRGTLSPGRHSVEVTARDLAGNASQKSWTFDVGSAMGAASASLLPLQVVAPGANAAVNGSDVVIQGRTAPGASVRVKVDAIAPPVGNRASVAQPVTQQTVVADADGNFSFTLGSFRAVMGTRFEVSMVANQGEQSAEQRLVLFQRPG
jgi:hypothetical protein